MNIEAALAAIKPEIEARFCQMIGRTFADLHKTFGPTFAGIYNSNGAKVWRETIRPLCARIPQEGDRSGMRSHYELDAGKVAEAAKAYAEAATAEWLDKINGKLGEVEAAEVLSYRGCNFAITAQRAGRKVRLEQQMILKASTKGTLFNQFPARLYIDGKFTPEAKYHAAFAA